MIVRQLIICVMLSDVKLQYLTCQLQSERLFVKCVLDTAHWKWPAQGTSTAPIVSAHFRSLLGRIAAATYRIRLEISTARRIFPMCSTLDRKMRSPKLPPPLRWICDAVKCMIPSAQLSPHPTQQLYRFVYFSTGRRCGQHTHAQRPRYCSSNRPQ